MYKNLFTKLVESPVWGQNLDVRVLWITMMATADNMGRVIIPTRDLCEMTHLPQTAFVRALAYLVSWQDYGMGVREIQGGWVMNNCDQFKQIITEDQKKEYKKLQMRKYRKDKEVEAKNKKEVAVAKKVAKKTGKTIAVWVAYSTAYKIRYGVDPIRNAMVNGQLSKFIDRVGEEEAPAIAAYYVRHDAAFYITKGHPVGLMLNDSEKLRMECATQVQISSTQASQKDRQMATKNAFKKLLVQAEEEECPWD